MDVIYHYYPWFLVKSAIFSMFRGNKCSVLRYLPYIKWIEDIDDHNNNGDIDALEPNVNGNMNNNTDEEHNEVDMRGIRSEHMDESECSDSSESKYAKEIDDIQ